MSGGVSILHISDLHYSRNHAANLALLIEPFLADVEATVLKYQKPDCIIFSGDLVNNPDESDSYYGVLEFLDRLGAIVGVPYNRIVMCPGNHDVSRRAIDDNKLEHDAIFANARDQNYLEHPYSKGQLTQYTRNISNNFFTTSALFDRPWTNPFVCTVSVPDRNLSILVINSTLCCTAEGSSKDLGNLAIPILPIEEALVKIPSNDLLMTVCHHPFSHLTEVTSPKLTNLVSKRSRAHFFGHLHDALPHYVVSPTGQTILLQSGALYVKSGVFLGYSVLRVTDRGEHPQIVFRSYMDGRGVFDAAVHVCHEGVFYPAPAAKAYWELQLPKLDKADFAAWLREKAYVELKIEHNVAFNGRPLEDTFVFPPLGKSSRAGDAPPDEDQPQVDELWDATDILEAPDNILILVPKESGATSLLASLSLQQCKGGPQQTAQRIPLFVDIRSVHPYAAYAVRTLRQAHPEVDHERYGWKKLSQLQPYLVLVDNYDVQNPGHSSSLSYLHASLPSAKFVVAVKTALSAPERINIDFKLPFSYSLLTLLPFGRRKVRSLVRNWSLPAALRENNVVEEILNRFRALNIPLTGPHISMFLMVLAEQKHFRPINQSTVIENFVEYILEKPNPEKIFRREVDFKEKAEVLSFFAEHLVKTDTGAVDSLEFINLVNAYYQRIGIRRNVSDLVAMFKEESVLEEFDSKITFKYNVLFSYFVAYRMRNSEEFKKYILDFGRFTNFVHEIDLYCGLTRHDLWALETVAAHYERITNEAPSDIRALSDYSTLERLVLPQVEDFDEFVTKFSESVVQELPRDERDKLLEGPQRSAAGFRQSLARRTAHQGALKWLFALRAYSVCLKNMETINKEEKEKHLRAILDGWARAVGFCVAIVGAGLEDRTIELGELKFRFDGFKRLDGTIMRMILTSVPSFVSGYMRADFGTEKLEVQLEEHSLANPALINMLRTGLITYLKLPEFLEYIAEYFRKSAPSLFLKEAMSVKLREFYLRYGFSDEESLELRRIMAEVDADIRGLRGEKRNDHVRRMLQSMEKKKLIEETRH